MKQDKARFLLLNNRTKQLVLMTIAEMVEEVNRDRSDCWTKYDENDYRDGIEVFTEYTLLHKEPVTGLIAMAPEMLGQLEALTDCLLATCPINELQNNNIGFDVVGIIEDAQQLIAKAKGE
jgi:hypothetical protein